MTKKYKVTIYYETYIEVEVESHNPDENHIAALAYCEAGNSKYDNQFLAHAQASDYSEIEEVEDED